MVLGVLVLCSLCMSVCRFTVSNDFESSRAIEKVRFFFFAVEAVSDCVVYYM